MARKPTIAEKKIARYLRQHPQLRMRITLDSTGLTVRSRAGRVLVRWQPTGTLLLGAGRLTDRRKELSHD